MLPNATTAPPGVRIWIWPPRGSKDSTFSEKSGNVVNASSSKACDPTVAMCSTAPCSATCDQVAPANSEPEWQAAQAPPPEL